MSKLYKLKVKEVKKETTDSVSVSFEIPNDLKQTFSFQSGQYLTLEKEINNEKVRRAYSIWKAPFENEVSVLIKEVENGKFSSFANHKLKQGDEMDVMPPIGNFKLKEDNNKQVFFAGGSGITPVISMIKHQLKNNPNKEVELFYLNKTAKDTVFKCEIEELQTKYQDKLNVFNFFTREKIENEIFHGRINKKKCLALIKEEILDIKAGGYYLCGPEEMIFDIQSTLMDKGVNKENIHFELFTASANNAKEIHSNVEEVKIHVTIDDDEFEYEYNTSNSNSLLDAGMDEGIDFPFSCKGGVCCTCKAKILEGKAEMKINYALTDSEVEEGYILTCQSHPTTPNLKITFDE
jgi:ring-1,2-phenylacetyl-CoA epoxidase subunit PaaE